MSSFLSKNGVQRVVLRIPFDAELLVAGHFNGSRRLRRQMDEEFLKLSSEALYGKLKPIIIYLDAARIERARHREDLRLCIVALALDDNKETEAALI